MHRLARGVAVDGVVLQRRSARVGSARRGVLAAAPPEQHEEAVGGQRLGAWGLCSIQPKAADTCAQGNDESCNGVLNEGCPCLQGATRSCADAGLVGNCASGMQTCSAQGTWGACSIQPAAEDTCVQGNNDNCSGPPNEGCACITGVTTRPCGACNDGTQLCTNGKTNQFGTCTGAVLTPTTYYRDADADGFGSSATTTVCSSTKPPGYSDQTRRLAVRAAAT